MFNSDDRPLEDSVKPPLRPNPHFNIRNACVFSSPSCVLLLAKEPRNAVLDSRLSQRKDGSRYGYIQMKLITSFRAKRASFKVAGARARAVSTLHHWMTHPPMTGRRGDYVTPGVLLTPDVCNGVALPCFSGGHPSVSHDPSRSFWGLRNDRTPVPDRGRFNPFRRKLGVPMDIFGDGGIFFGKDLTLPAIRNIHTSLRK